MKKLYFVLIGFLMFSGVEAQIINFPDANFKAKLLSASSSNSIASTQTPIYSLSNDTWNVSTYNKIDTNNDGEIQLSEALSIKYLDVNNSAISNLQGIENFVNLNYLCCSSNQVTSLNASVLTNLVALDCYYNQLLSINLGGLINLKSISCDHNQLTSLNVSGLINLKFLSCDHNQLTSLNIGGLLNLNTLYCGYNNIQSFSGNGLSNLNMLVCSNNPLTSLNLSGLTNLRVLYCSNTQLTNIDLSGLTNMQHIICDNNQLTSLNVSGLINLESITCEHNQLTSIDFGVLNINYFDTLYCRFNQLTTLDLSNLIYLNNLVCDNNQLTSINIKNGRTENNLFFSANPNLQYICADDQQIATIQNLITQYGYTNCYVNSYCSFTPGGTFYTIQGNNRYDEDNNGCSTTDINYPNLQLAITDSTNAGSVFANNTGVYSIPVQAGTQTITPTLENPTYFNVSPTTATVTFPTATSPYTQDFCITANGTHNDLEITLLPIGLARPGFDAYYQIVYKNKGTNTQSGTVNLAFNDAVLDYVSAIPSVALQTLNNLSWNFSNLAPFETRVIDVVLNLNTPIEVPPLNSGDVLNYSATVNGLTDETPIDNSAILNQTVVNAFDPNYKTCTEGTTIAPSEVGKYVHYIIGFENDGTANAENIVVKDMIDTTKYDITTLVPIRGSAPFTTRIFNTNQVEFIFQNINLPFASGSNQGYVAFKIKTKPTLVLGNTFSNTANIYFDYNAPIVTNTATTTIAALVNLDFVFGDYFTLSPIPAKGVININTKQDIAITSISIYNTLGQVVLVASNPSNTIDVSSLTAGSYFIKVITDKGTSSGKFIKE